MKIYREIDDYSLTICYELNDRELEILEWVGNNGSLEFEGKNYPSGVDICNVADESEIADLVFFGFLKEDGDYFIDGYRKYIITTLGYEFLMYR